MNALDKSILPATCTLAFRFTVQMPKMESTHVSQAAYWMNENLLHPRHVLDYNKEYYWDSPFCGLITDTHDSNGKFVFLWNKALLRIRRRLFIQFDIYSGGHVRRSRCGKQAFRIRSVKMYDLQRSLIWKLMRTQDVPFDLTKSHQI